MRRSKWLTTLFLGFSGLLISLSAHSALADTFSGSPYPSGSPNYYASSAAIPGETYSFYCTGATPLTFQDYGYATAPISSLGGDQYSFTYPAAVVNYNFALLNVATTSQEYTDTSLNANCGIITFTGTPGTAAIAFYSPTELSTVADFTDWYLSLSGVSTTSEYRVDVEYTAFGGGTTYDDFNLITPTYPTAMIPKTQTLASGTSTSWIATAYLINSTSTSYFLAETDPAAVLSSTTIEFTIGVGSSTTPTLPSSSTIIAACGAAPASFFEFTGSLPYFEINNPIPIFDYGACISATFLFIPDSGQSAALTTGLSNAEAIINKKPPFGYFAAAITDMGSFAVATSSTSTILDATSTTEIYSIYEPLDAGIAAIIGFMLLLWFFNRGRHFNL